MITGHILISLRLDFAVVVCIGIATLRVDPGLLTPVILRVTPLHGVQVDILRNRQRLGTLVYKEAFLAGGRDATVGAE